MSDTTARATAHWEPFDEVARVRIPRRFGEPVPLAHQAWRNLEEHGLHPPTDLFENDDRFFLTIELPGARSSDVAVEVDGRHLTVRGEKRSEREGKKKEQRRSFERRYGTFSRSFTLPSDADASRVEAKLDDGVLTVKVRKAKSAKSRAVAIRS